MISETLQQFIEEDIIKFLDKKAEEQKIYQLTNKQKIDFYQNIYQALKYGNIATASKNLIEQIYDYNQEIPTSIYKKIKYNKVLESVSLIKKYLDSTGYAGEINQTIKRIDEIINLSENIPAKIILQGVEKQAKGELKKARAEFEEKENLLKKREQLTKEIFLALRKKDIKNAVLKYRELKQVFNQIPSVYLNDKKDLYNDLIGFYLQIKKLYEELKKSGKLDEQVKKSKTTPTKKEPKQLNNQNLETPRNPKEDLGLNPNNGQQSESDNPLLQQLNGQQTSKNDFKNTDPKITAQIQQTIMQIKEHIEEVKTKTQQKQYGDVKNTILEMRHKVDMIPNNYTHLKQTLNGKINLLIQRVEFIKRQQ